MLTMTLAVMAAQETIWEWIVAAENWGHPTSLRDPIIATTRADLAYAFQVFHR